MTQNDEAWENIFGRLRLLPEIERNGFIYVPNFARRSMRR
jgi:hypothetical protein